MCSCLMCISRHIYDRHFVFDGCVNMQLFLPSYFFPGYDVCREASYLIYLIATNSHRSPFVVKVLGKELKNRCASIAWSW